MKYVVKMSFIK